MRTKYPKKIMYKAGEAEVSVQMWTRGEREEVEREYGVRGSTYLNTVIGVFQRNPHAQALVERLIMKEQKRLDEHGLNQEIDTVIACLVDAPFDVTKKELMALEDDEYTSVVNAVRSVIFRYDEKAQSFERELALIVKDEKMQKKVVNLANQVWSGQYQKKG